MAASGSEPPCVDIEVDVEETPAPHPAPVPAPAPADPAPTPSTDEHGLNPIHDLINQVIHLNQEINLNQQQNNGWPMWAKVAIGAAVTILAIVLALVVTFVSLHASRRGGGGGGGKGNNLGCIIQISVSKDGRSNFTRVSDAVEASPNNSPVRICIFVGAGEYDESVTIDEQKTNLALIGEGIDKTIILSNTTSNRFLDPNSWPGATLNAYGENFLGQDLTVRSGASTGVAVENTAKNSNLFRCRFEGANSTVHIKGFVQFYRDCQFYGRTYLLYGYARAYFQNCQFFSKKTYADEKVVFASQSFNHSDHGFVFHLCEFHIVGTYANYSRTTFLSSSSGNYALLVVIKSYLDPSLAGYLFGTPANFTDYEVFGNRGLDSTAGNVPSFVHFLRNLDDASRYSLRKFIDGTRYIAKGVDYDLDIVE